MSSYRNVEVKGVKIFLEGPRATVVEQILEENRELREKLEKVTLPRLEGTPIDQPIVTSVSQVISHLRFWEEHPADIKRFTEKELAEFFGRLAQQLEDGEKASSTVVALQQDDGKGSIPKATSGGVRHLREITKVLTTNIKNNPARITRLWPNYQEEVELTCDVYEEQSEQESRDISARQSQDEPRPELSLVRREDEPSGKEIVRVRQPTPPATTAPTPAADEDIEIIDVFQTPLGGIGKRKPADEPYHEDDTRERKERPALPTVREAYAATRQSDVTPANELLLREVTKADLRRATVTRRIGVHIPDSDFEPDDDGAVKPSDLAHEEIVSDTETLADNSLDSQIRRQQRKKISVWKKLGPRKPNKKEEEKLAGYDTEVRRLRILKAQTAGVPQEKIPTVLYLWGQQDRERISRKEKQQLKDLLE